VVAASPALIAIAWLLFTGGSASKLPMRPLLVTIAALVLCAGAYLAIGRARSLVLRAPSLSRKRAALIVAGLFVLHVALAKIDQLVLPGHYGYLHGLLTALTWLSAALAVAILAVRSTRVEALD